MGNTHADIAAQCSSVTCLTPRERDVMAYVVRGQSNKVIAAELAVSRRTIEAHRARIFQKLDVRNAVELAHWLWLRNKEERPKGALMTSGFRANTARQFATGFHLSDQYPLDGSDYNPGSE
jgi:DNA-binding CsgD family transcriptional regulator